MPQRYMMLVMANAKDNNNKFYEITLTDNDEVQVRYGRVGNDGMKESKGHGAHVFESVARQKKNKGYKEVSVAVQNTQGQPQRSLAEVAKRDLTGGGADPVMSALIERLAAINRHQLMAATGGQIRIEDGQVKTPVGLVTLDSVLSAQTLLETLEKMVGKRQTAHAKYTSALEEYLTLVPQRVPSRRGWGPGFFTEHSSFVRQHDLLEQLESSIKSIEADRASRKPDPALPTERLFNYGIQPVTDKATVSEIERYYLSQVNRSHVSSRLRPKRVYALDNPKAAQAYSQRLTAIGNAQKLWHGTRACNILSILKNGLIIPKSGGNYTITGRMFGDGLYFSDQSSKALNYAYGYWDHGPKDNNCFMFLCQVAMGKSYIPASSGNGNKPGYHSCFAQAGKSGVLNNEMIVYSLDQVQLTHLVEFDL